MQFIDLKGREKNRLKMINLLWLGIADVADSPLHAHDVIF
jgi:hypothetical protein